ncbi:glycosyltransferase family 2 protein [bacterium C-53]|nr:glycosyltransferase family 2 protein [Lachnospiraceae bacterium]NBI02647.1 glycosyltransferase family 2 protein [Lachnospiraceae bacterium]RKJ11383.1 glycosyltransferase family 2 protein [bacterium C-53]
MKTLIIIPAYNEAENIENLIKELKFVCPFADYLVVNDSSNDNSEEILQELDANYMSNAVNLGIGGTVQAGYMYALKNGYEIAVQVDGDGQHDISYLRKLIEPIEKGDADIVIGSRFIEKEGFQSSITRRLGINLLSVLIWICTGVKVKDVTSGFRAVNKRFIQIYALDYPQDYPEPEAIVAAVMNKGRIKEIPVVMNERVGGVSSINLWKSVYYMIKVSMAIVICRISFGIRR